MAEATLVLTRAPAFSAALGHAHARWAERGGLLVVPSREAAGDALREAAADGPVVGREAITFAALRGRVASALGIAESEAPSRIATRLALGEVLAGCDLGAFGASARTPGFLEAIERVLGELREARVAPERAQVAATTPVAAAVAAVYAAAFDLVPHPADALWSVADHAAALTSFPAVTVVGFDDLVPGQWSLLRALAATAPVEVVLPYAEGRAAFAARRDRHAVWSRGADVRTLPEGPRGLASAVFEDGPPLADPPPVRLVGAAGTAGLLRAALDEALEVAAGGVPLDEIALVVPRLTEVRDELQRLLDAWGVPATFTTRMRVTEAPVALALTHLMHLGEAEADDPATLDHLLGWLRSPYSGAAADDVDRFEIDARRGRLARGQMLARWEGEAIGPARRMVRAATAGPRAQLAAMLEVGWDALRRVEDPATTPSRADLRDREALGSLSGLVPALSDEGAAGDDAAPPRARGPLPPGALGAIIADLTVLVREGAPGGLRIHDFASIRGRSHEVVVIAGLDGDGYPGGPAPDAFLAALRPVLGDELPPRAPGTTESRLRFVHALDSARSGVRLVRRVVDDAGREVAPSPYWLEVCRLVGRLVDALDRRTGARGEVATPDETVRSEREALRAVALAGGRAPGALDAAIGRRSRTVGVSPGAFRDRTRFRVTEIESYLSCPYGWFHANALAPNAIEEPLDAAYEGSFGHTLMEQTYGTLLQEGAGACGPETLDRYRAELERQVPLVAGELRPPGAGAPYDALVERMRRHLSAMLGREAALGSTFVPTHLERRIEDDRIVADVAPGVVISGQLDRLDVSPAGDRVLVVDYKRSGADFDPTSDEVAKRLQLPLYGRMAAAHLVAGSRSAGGLYMGMLRPKTTGAVVQNVGGPVLRGRAMVDEETWERIGDEAVDAVREVVRRVRDGELAAPGTSACAPWCRCGDLWR